MKSKEFGMDKARKALIKSAKRNGGNAILDLTVKTRTERAPGWFTNPNYKQTRHCLRGRVVTLKLTHWR